jgi:hypothetical protein
MKDSLTFISLILILIISGCTSTSSYINVDLNNDGNQSALSRMLNKKELATKADRDKVVNDLEKLFTYKNVKKSDVEIVLSHIDNNYVKKEFIGNISKAIQTNKKIKALEPINLSYITSKKNKEYIIESSFEHNPRFNISFEENNGKKVKNNLLQSNLISFCKTFLDDQRDLIETSLFSNKLSEKDVIVVYMDQFKDTVDILKKRYPDTNYLQVDNNNYEEFAEQTLDIYSSTKRFNSIQSLDRNLKLENNPRVKQDFDKIYFLLDYDLGKFLVPIFRSYLINTDFYSTSEIILNVSNIKELNDFEGMLIPSHEYFFKQVSNKKEILNFNDEYNKALINDLLTAEKLKRLNVNAIDVIFETSPAVFNSSECIKRNLPLWRVTLNNFTDRS